MCITRIMKVASTFEIYVIYIISYLFTYECTSDCPKKKFKIYIKTAPTCFGVTVTPSSWSALFALAKVTLCQNNCCASIYDQFPNSVYCRAVQHTYTSKDLLMSAATSPPN